MTRKEIRAARGVRDEMTSAVEPREEAPAADESEPWTTNGLRSELGAT